MINLNWIYWRVLLLLDHLCLGLSNSFWIIFRKIGVFFYLTIRIIYQWSIIFYCIWSSTSFCFTVFACFERNGFVEIGNTDNVILILIFNWILCVVNSQLKKFLSFNTSFFYKVINILRLLNFLKFCLFFILLYSGRFLLQHTLTF